MAMQKGYIRTHSGETVYPLNPTPATINIRDIAWHLSHVNRFTGGSSKPYSVALHSLTVSALAKRKGMSFEAQMACLVHDGSEAYLNDIAAPVKDDPRFDFYREAEDHLQKMIYLRYGLRIDESLAAAVKICDSEMFCAEWVHLMATREEGIPEPTAQACAIWNQFCGLIDHPDTVRAAFLDRFLELTNQLEKR